MSKFFTILFTFQLYLFLTAPLCKENSKFCNKCNPLTGLCIKCSNPLLTPDKTGGCIGSKACTIGQNYCEKCSEEADICSSCEAGYYPDENGACSYTEHCVLSYKGKCLQCQENFILIGSDEINGLKICKSLDSQDLKHCEVINAKTGFCEVCEKDFHLNMGDLKCTSTPNCLESIYDQCISCVYGFYLDVKNGKKCQKYLETNNTELQHCKVSEDKGVTCSKCWEDYYLVSEGGRCSSSNNCEQSENSICQKCRGGYYISEANSACVIDKNCRTGDFDTGLCLVCKEGFYVDQSDGKCYSNQEEDDLNHCIEYSKDNLCISCEKGYFLGEDKQCSSTEHCEKAEFGKCKKCLEGFFLGEKDSKCSGTEHCSKSDQYGRCAECEDGFYFDKYSKCFPAEKEFENCKFSNYMGTKCEQCKEGFYLLSEDYLCYEIGKEEEKEKFENCVLFDGEKCIKCLYGFYLGSEDFKCTKLSDCAVSKDEVCVKCSDENFSVLDLKTGTCENNYLINEEKIFYYKCKETNKKEDQCEECISNYTLSDEGLCVNEFECEEKNEKGECIKCNNYPNGLSTFCLNDLFGCAETFYNLNCLKCNNGTDFDTCTECHDGFTLISGGCYKFEEEKKDDKDDKEEEDK